MQRIAASGGLGCPIHGTCPERMATLKVFIESRSRAQAGLDLCGFYLRIGADLHDLRQPSMARAITALAVQRLEQLSPHGTEMYEALDLQAQLELADGDVLAGLRSIERRNAILHEYLWPPDDLGPRNDEAPPDVPADL